VWRIHRPVPMLVFMTMTLAPKIGIALASFAVLGGGAVLWAKFGGLVYFDMLTSSFIGCFF
jgi:hypothetical protein